MPVCNEDWVRMLGWRNVIDAFADLVYPPQCPLCDSLSFRHSKPCDDCQRSLQKIEGAAHLHLLSRVWIDRCISCYAYEGSLREAIHGFKYEERFDLLEFFAYELARTFVACGKIDAICPVPMHPRRLKSRGYNPAALLADRVGQRLGTSVYRNLLRRTRHAPCQMELARKERLANVKGTFAVDDKAATRVDGRRLLVLDDVLTTGATANECARVLKKKGASYVVVLTIARTL